MLNIPIFSSAWLEDSSVKYAPRMILFSRGKTKSKDVPTAVHVITRNASSENVRNASG